MISFEFSLEQNILRKIKYGESVVKDIENESSKF
jgi:hypothetical protein